MPIYLAYQFEPRQLTQRRLRRIIGDWLEFDTKEDINNVYSWFNLLEETEAFFKTGGTLLRRAAMMGYSHMKGYPLILFGFRGRHNSAGVPDNFSGLHIKDAHALQAISEMKKLKPIMDPYLREELGIDYVDRSNLSLD